MILNISNDKEKNKILKILKTSLKDIDLKKEYEISFSIKEQKYILEIIKNKEKVIFKKIDEINENREFFNLRYNIKKLINYIDRNKILKYFIKQRKANEKYSENQSDLYGYDTKRATPEKISIYENLADLILQTDYELESYDYERVEEIEMNFFGTKVQLKISEYTSDFIYFSENIDYEGLKLIAKKLDKSILEKKKDKKNGNNNK